MNNNPQEEFQKWKDKEKSPFTTISRNVKPIWIILFFLGIFGANWLVTSGQVSRGTFFLFIGGMLLVIILIITKGSPEPKELSEQVCKQIALNAMEVKRKEGIEFPSDSVIRTTPLFGSCYEQDVMTGTSGVVNKEVGVEVIIKNRYKKSYVVRLHPINGTIRDILPRRLGINTEEALVKDRKTIPVQFLDNKS
ncbi:MAG: hypothetical protein WC758_07720 [Candidatus Woesearchaeota archaeon]|jgi:hypothetical protein